MAKKRPQKGDLVIITFLDHAENSRDVLRFEVIGRLSGITRTAFLVKSWGYVCDVDRAGDGNAENETVFAIVRKAVEELRVIK